MIAEFLVVWSGEGPVFQSKVVADSNIVETYSNNHWILLAAESEGWSEKEIQYLLNNGYDLYLVCPFPDKFYGG